MAAYQGNKPYIFLNYSHRDKELAHYVVNYLQEHNFNVWYDEGIHTGTHWEKVIADKIANPNCWMMVFLATKNSLASEWCGNELRFAKEEGKKFINVVIGSPQFPDWFICDFTCYQFVNEAEFASRDAMMDKLVKELIHHEMDTDKPKDTQKDTTKDTPTPSPTEGLEFSIVDGTARVDRYEGTDTKVIIPATIIRNGKTYKVTSIGKSAFLECSSLSSISIPNSVTTIGAEAFVGCSSLTSISIPNSVTTIGERAFFWCKKLTSITIPDSVTTIGKEAFRSCTNLTSISIPNSVTSIGESAFERCENLTIYCEAKSMPKGWDSDWNPDNRPVVWNCGSSSPKEDEVCGSSKPSTDSTTTPKPSPTEGLEFSIVDDTAKVTNYKGTDTKVIIPATIIRNGKTYKVTSIGESAFKDCTNLTSITIPESVTSIGKSAFEWCENLTSVSIPYSVTTVGRYAFSGCHNLTSITIPNSVTSMGRWAFFSCTSLTIYCEKKSKPIKWHAWNPDKRPVVWGCKLK